MRKKILLSLLGIVLFLLIINSRNFFFRNDEAKGQYRYAYYLMEIGMYREAIDEFKIYIEKNPYSSSRDDAQMFIAKIYMDKLFDYRNALKEYLALNYLYPKNKWRNLAKEKINECLLYLDLPAEKKDIIPDGKIVAKIGNEKITQNQIEKAWNKLTEEEKKKLGSKEKFIEYYIENEALYLSALSSEKDFNSIIIRNLLDLRKELIIQEYLKENITFNTNVDTIELKSYYEINKNSFIEKGKTIVSYVILKDKEKAEILINKALKLKNFKSFVEQSLSDPSLECKINTLVTLQSDSTDTMLFNIAQKIKENRFYDKLILSGNDYIILYVDKKSTDRQKKFFEVKEEIRERIISERYEGAIADLKKKAKERYKIKMNP